MKDRNSRPFFTWNPEPTDYAVGMDAIRRLRT